MYRRGHGFWKRMLAFVLALLLLPAMDQKVVQAERLISGSAEGIRIQITYGQTAARSLAARLNQKRLADSPDAGELVYDSYMESLAMECAKNLAVLYSSQMTPDGYSVMENWIRAEGIVDNPAESIACASTQEEVLAAWTGSASSGDYANLMSAGYVGIGHVTYNGHGYWAAVYDTSAHSSGVVGTARDDTETVDISLNTTLIQARRIANAPTGTLYLNVGDYYDLSSCRAELLVDGHMPQGEYCPVQGTVSVTPQDQSVLSYNGTSLVAKAAGSTRVNITCGGCTQEFAVEVTQPSITDATIDAISDQTYTGNAITPGVTVRLGSKVLTQNVDYTVSYSNNTSIGTAYVTVSGRGNYTGTKTAYFRIAAPTVSNAVVTAIPDQTYTGSALYPLVYVYVNNTLLRENTDYTLAYTNNVNIGTASVAITGMGSYSGTKTVTFRILGPGMSAATIETIPDQLYTGSDIRPTVTVTLNNTTLKLNTDYTVSYSNNRNVGTATVTITGRGSYSGTKTTTFRILSKDISNTTVSSIGSQTYTGLEIYPDVTVKIGTVTLTKGVDYTLSYRNNIKPGTASITINGAGSYTGSKIVTFQITRLSLADATIKVANQTCNGKAKKPKVTVRLDGETLRSGDDYTCTYSNNKNPGKASVKVKGTGAYSGTRTVYFVILPKKMTLRSAEARTKAAYLTWKADSGVSGYELFRSTKKASGYRRIATINQVGASACTNTALSAGTYYYKIRSYVVVDGKKYYGAFSSVKRVKIK